MWSRWVRPLVAWMTTADPCATIERAKAQDPELEGRASVLYHWHSVIGGKPVTVSEVIESAIEQNLNFALETDGKRFAHDAFREALLAVAGNAGNIDSRRLGNWLARFRDRIASGKKIISATKASGYGRWQVVRVSDADAEVGGAVE